MGIMLRNLREIIKILKWKIYGENSSNSRSIWSFTRIKDKVLDIIIQNLKQLAMMKRRTHLIVLIVIPPTRALHPIPVISENYTKVMMWRWTFQNLKVICHLIISWLNNYYWANLWFQRYSKKFQSKDCCYQAKETCFNLVGAS